MKLASSSSADPQGLWLGKPAPRYTSYPPAPFFHTKVGVTDYVKSLTNLPADDRVSLYLHIPFCRALCLYCGCNTAITSRKERLDKYIAALKQEITMITKIIGRRQVSHMHFGGGTPNIIPDNDMRELFDFLHENFDFSGQHEVAMELDPRVVTESQIKTLAACGVTRVSLGVQDFNPEVQALVNRRQPYDVVANVCGWLRAAGITRINFDLMYGLPKQTPETVADTATRVCGLRPDRVALFSYAHVPQMKPFQRVLEAYGLPDLHERLALDQVARGILISHDYYAIGIDHFAQYDDPIMKVWREGRLHRNFQGYTEDTATTLLSFGASSISQTPDGYFQNERDEGLYQELVNNDQLPTRRGYMMTPEDCVRRAIIERLMCSLSCDIDDICQQYEYPVDVFDDDLKRLQPFEDAEIIRRAGSALCLTTPYRMAIRAVCEVFDNHSRYAERMPASRTA